MVTYLTLGTQWDPFFFFLGRGKGIFFSRLLSHDFLYVYHTGQGNAVARYGVTYVCCCTSCNKHPVGNRAFFSFFFWRVADSTTRDGPEREMLRWSCRYSGERIGHLFSFRHHPFFHSLPYIPLTYTIPFVMTYRQFQLLWGCLPRVRIGSDKTERPIKNPHSPLFPYLPNARENTLHCKWQHINFFVFGSQTDSQTDVPSQV